MRKTEIISASVMMALTFTLTIATPSLAAPALGSRGSTTISSTEGMTLKEAKRMAAAADSTLIELRQMFQLNGEIITVGVAADSSGNLPTDLVSNMVKALRPYTDPATASLSATSRTSARGAVGEAIANLQVNGPKFQEVDLAGSVPTEGLPSDVSGESAAVQPKGELAPNATAACGSTWWPALTSNYSYGDNIGRYNTLSFKWSSTTLAALQCSGSNSFEPDFVTYNYDNAYYFSSTMFTWSSNLPDAYWDTNAFDSSSERVYTVGSATTSKLVAGRAYQTFIQMGKGNASSDTAKVVWQRSTYAWGCPAGPAWCISADASRIQYAWNIRVPGTFSGIV